MKRTSTKRRHGIGSTRWRAVIALFCAGFDPRAVARLLALTPPEVLHTIRQHGRGHRR
jgi:hypothetical protein